MVPAMALTFDTRKAVQKLRQQGLAERAADGIVEVVEEATNTVVTADILRSELQALRGEFRAEMAEFRGEFRTEFAQVRTEMAENRAEMADFRAEMWRAFWIFGTGIVAAGGVIVTVANVLG